jgi:hypothetical protein
MRALENDDVSTVVLTAFGPSPICTVSGASHVKVLEHRRIARCSDRTNNSKIAP